MERPADINYQPERREPQGNHKPRLHMECMDSVEGLDAEKQDEAGIRTAGSSQSSRGPMHSQHGRMIGGQFIRIPFRVLIVI